MAPEYLSPGVYVEEVDRGTKPIESVGTSTLGILGTSKKGPRNEATLITNWSQFTRVFGETLSIHSLRQAAMAFSSTSARLSVRAPTSLKNRMLSGS